MGPRGICFVHQGCADYMQMDVLIVQGQCYYQEESVAWERLTRERSSGCWWVPQRQCSEALRWSKTSQKSWTRLRGSLFSIQVKIHLVTSIRLVDVFISHLVLFHNPLNQVISLDVI